MSFMMDNGKKDNSMVMAFTLMEKETAMKVSGYIIRDMEKVSIFSIKIKIKIILMNQVNGKKFIDMMELSLIINVVDWVHLLGMILLIIKAVGKKTKNMAKVNTIGKIKGKNLENI